MHCGTYLELGGDGVGLVQDTRRSAARHGGQFARIHKDGSPAVRALSTRIRLSSLPRSRADVRPTARRWS